MDIQFEPYGNLLLDSDNPRLAGVQLNIADQDQILKWLWKNKVVDELVDSMLAGGYWPHEELFVSKEKGKFVVIEGNRTASSREVVDGARNPKAARDQNEMEAITQDTGKLRGAADHSSFTVGYLGLCWI